MDELYLWAMWFSGLVMGIGLSAAFLAIKQWIKETVIKAVREAQEKT